RVLDDVVLDGGAGGAVDDGDSGAGGTAGGQRLDVHRVRGDVRAGRAVDDDSGRGLVDHEVLGGRRVRNREIDLHSCEARGHLVAVELDRGRPAGEEDRAGRPAADGDAGDLDVAGARDHQAVGAEARARHTDRGGRGGVGVTRVDRAFEA